MNQLFDDAVAAFRKELLAAVECMSKSRDPLELTDSEREIHRLSRMFAAKLTAQVLQAVSDDPERRKEALTQVRERAAQRGVELRVERTRKTPVRTLNGGASYVNTAGWTYPTAFTSLFGLTGTKRGYVRFGLLAINDSGSATGSGQARLSVEQRPSAGRSVFGGPVKVNTDGTTTAIFQPLTGPLQTADIAELRATLRLEAASGLDGSDNSLIQLQPAYQVSETPDDWGDWGTAVAFGTNATTEGTHFGTTFESVSVTARYIRFGVLAKNDSDSSDIEACCVSLRVDLRN